MTCRQRDELIAPADEKRIGADRERLGSLAHEGCEGSLDIALGAGFRETSTCSPSVLAAALQVFRHGVASLDWPD